LRESQIHLSFPKGNGPPCLHKEEIKGEHPTIE
jgi:hypothetical protein